MPADADQHTRYRITQNFGGLIGSDDATAAVDYPTAHVANLEVVMQTGTNSRSLVGERPHAPRWPQIALPREFRLLPALALVAFLGVTIDATAQGQPLPFDRECAMREIKVITLIEEHGAAQDLPADRLTNAALTMLHARSTCSLGRVAEALTLYDNALDLGNVASLRRQ